MPHFPLLLPQGKGALPFLVRMISQVSGDPGQLPSAGLAHQSARGPGAPRLTGEPGGCKIPACPQASAPGEMRGRDEAVRPQGRRCGTDDQSSTLEIKTDEHFITLLIYLLCFCSLNCSQEKRGVASHTCPESQARPFPPPCHGGPWCNAGSAQQGPTSLFSADCCCLVTSRVRLCATL